MLSKFHGSAEKRRCRGSQVNLQEGGVIEAHCCCCKREKALLKFCVAAAGGKGGVAEVLWCYYRERSHCRRSAMLL